MVRVKMASMGCSSFSPDGQFFANCGIDGKLRIWETSTSRLKQEYIPNLHLSSPSSVFTWITVSHNSNTSPSPWRKRRKKSVSEDSESKLLVAMGSTNGEVVLYDLSRGCVSNTLKNGHSARVTAIAWSESSGLFSAADDRQIVEWSLQEASVRQKWKSGKDGASALAATLDGASLLSAEGGGIKWWDISTKQLIFTFTGHAEQVTSLNVVQVDSSNSYLISAAAGDEYLGVWSLNRNKKEKNSIATLTLKDNPVTVSAKVVEDSHIFVAVPNVSGRLHLFKYQQNGNRSKPLKPAVNVLVSSSESGAQDKSQQMPIVAAQIMENSKVLLAYGSFVNLVFETVVPDYTSKLQTLVRTDLKKSKDKKQDTVTKVKETVDTKDVEYLAPGSNNVPIKRNKVSTGGSQLPLKQRLENLCLRSESKTPGTTPKTGKGANMAQLLIQGLQSKDKGILSTVLLIKRENVIHNTVASLPVQAIPPLLKELTALLQGKTYPSKIAVMWLKALVAEHAAHLLSHPDLGETLEPILGLIDAKLMLMPAITRLKGRVSLLTGQISHRNNEGDNMLEESLLTYQDGESSDEGSDDLGEVGMRSDSEESWEELSDKEEEESGDEIANGKCNDDNDSSSG